MDETKLRTIEQLREFLAATPVVKFTHLAGGDDAQRYAHISRVLNRFDYCQRGKRERGVVLEYLRHTSGYSRPHITRLVARWQKNRLATTPLAKRYQAPRAPFARKHTSGDIALLVEMDRAHEDVCGPAIAHLLRRAYTEYGDVRYERLATLSVSHLYNLRKTAGYQKLRVSFTKTRAVCNPIGVRKAPRPNGRAGWVRIDSVHQGDLDGAKGVYHITCVDSVSQWQVQACVQGISEAYLLAVLQAVLQAVIEQFPFVIEGFHSDNGSEYINHKAAKLLEKLRIEQTKSRSRHSNDNALAASQERQRGQKAHGLQPHSPEVRQAHQRVLRRCVQFVAELAPPLLVCHRGGHGQRPGQDCSHSPYPRCRASGASGQGKLFRRSVVQNGLWPLDHQPVCLICAQKPGCNIARFAHAGKSPARRMGVAGDDMGIALA